MLGPVCFWIFRKFAIFNHFTAETVRITVFLDDFLCSQFIADFHYLLIGSFNRSFNVRNMLLEIFIIQQVIFRKIVEGTSRFFQVIEFCPSFKSFTIACCYIGGNIDIQASFSGQMPWSFYFVTIFSQTDADIFF